MVVRSAFPVAIALLVGFAAFESGTAIANDDFGYLMWGLQTRDDLLAWVSGPEWFTYRRPLNALVWWLSAQTGIDAELARWTQVGLWTLFGGALLWATRSSVRGLITLVLLLMTNQVFVDLLTWRSWLTTTGSLAFLGLSAVAVERRAPALLVALLGLLTLGFKEVSAVAVALIALSQPGYRWVGAMLFGSLVVSARSSAHKLGMQFLADNILFHLDTVALFVPAVPVLVAARFPKLPPWALVLPVVLVVVPAPARAAAFVLASGLFLSGEPRWLLPAGAAFGLPLIGAYHARQYLLESWAVVLIALATRRNLSSAPTIAWLAVAILAAPSVVDFERSRHALREESASQQAFLREFRPAPANHLYHPDSNWSWNLDALHWVQGGATLEGLPPPDTEPVQIGPLSGVWADVKPGQGSGNR